MTVGEPAPTAAFTASVVNLAASFDGSGSTDPDGTIASYAWDFGDRTTGTGATPSHTYATAGTYQVKLTVTDNRGGTGSLTKPLTVTTGPLAQDTFTRTVTGGWGTANTGGAWTLSGSTSLFAVGSGVGTMSMSGAGKGAAAALGSVSSTDTDVQMQFALDKASTGGGQYVSLVGRGISFTSDYRTKVVVSKTSTVEVTLSRIVGGTETELSSVVLPGVTYTPGTLYSVRMQVWGTGTTNLRAKVWKSSDVEPTAWTVTRTDATSSLQAPGWVGVACYLSGTATNAPVKLTVDNLMAGRTGN